MTVRAAARLPQPPEVIELDVNRPEDLDVIGIADDELEASLAALYLQHGFEPIREAVVAAFDGRITYALTTHVDHKTELQEELARQGRQVAYNVLDVQGPPHDRTFTCAAVIDGEEVGVGTGRSKKDAEQAAAREALDRLAHAA